MKKASLIDKRNLYEQVAEHLEGEILSGNYNPGDRLPPERELQEIYAVGRPAIREALISLQNAGLIVIGNGGPARVSRATPDKLLSGIRPGVLQILRSNDGRRQLEGVRRFAEVGLVRHFAQNATAEELENLDLSLVANKKAIGDPEKFTATDIGFHFEFANAMHNPAFNAIHQALSDWLEFLRSVALQEPGFDKLSYEEHVQIRDAVRARDADKSEMAMLRHLESGSKVFWRQFEKE
jgi:GntR family transcriptional regulator, sialic acid-inducible nan operon repressor